MAGLTNEGFVIKRLPDVITELRNQAITIFQDLLEDPNDVVDTSDSSTLGRLIGLVSPSLSDLWEAAQQDYAAFDPNSATGIALDNLVALGGISRQEETFSTAQALLTGDNGTLVSSGLTVGSDVSATQWQLSTEVALSPTLATGAGFIITSVVDSTDYSITYATSSTTNTITFNSGIGATTASILQGLKAAVDASHPSLTATLNTGNSLLSLQRVDEFSTVNFTVSAGIGISKISKLGELVATTAGPESAEVNTLVNILTPLLGWDSVTNILAASAGSFRETDEGLRERFRNTKFERASNILEALYSALINVDGVEEVKIYENDTDATDINGVPPHSFLSLVVGGTSLEIAETIWQNKPLGIQAYGNTEVTITDSQGFGHDIGFSRPDPVSIYISMTLTTDSNFPATGVEDIKSALISYFEQNVKVGDDVVYSRLYTPINSVAGHQVDSLTIGTSPAPVGTSNITIAFDEIASLSSTNIVITT